MKRATATRPSTAITITPPRTDNDTADALDGFCVLMAVVAEVVVEETALRGLKIVDVLTKTDVKVVVGKNERAEYPVLAIVEAVMIRSWLSSMPVIWIEAVTVTRSFSLSRLSGQPCTLHEFDEQPLS